MMQFRHLTGSAARSAGAIIRDRAHPKGGAKPEFLTILSSVADDDDVVHMGAAGGVYPGWLLVDVVYVPEAHRRRGHGTRLLQELEAAARLRGAHSAYLFWHCDDTPAFYGMNGYQPLAMLQNFGGAGKNLYLLQKGLKDG